ncbi:MAG TPA: hypothetical protein VL689_16355 [Paraburkholderia sp.]|nr:hypothetical protein [Paraburkholderia sp.]
MAVIEQMAPDSRKHFALASKSFADLAKPALKVDLAQKHKADAVLTKIAQLDDDAVQFSTILSEVQELEEFFQTGLLTELASKLFLNGRQIKFNALTHTISMLPPEYRETVLGDIPSRLVSEYFHRNVTPRSDSDFREVMTVLREMIATLPPEYRPKGIIGLAKATAFFCNESEFEQLRSAVATLSPQHQAAALPRLIRTVFNKLPPPSTEIPSISRSSLSRLVRRDADTPELAAQHAFQRRLGAGKEGEGSLWNMVKALPDVNRAAALTELTNISYIPLRDRRDGFLTILGLIKGLPREYQAKPLAKLVPNTGSFVGPSHGLLKDIIQLTKKIPKQSQRVVLEALKKEVSSRFDDGESSYKKDLATINGMLGQLVPR